jgi:hypothetical protein
MESAARLCDLGLEQVSRVARGPCGAGYTYIVMDSCPPRGYFVQLISELEFVTSNASTSLGQQLG